MNLNNYGGTCLWFLFGWFDNILLLYILDQRTQTWRAISGGKIWCLLVIIYSTCLLPARCGLWPRVVQPWIWTEVAGGRSQFHRVPRVNRVNMSKSQTTIYYLPLFTIHSYKDYFYYIANYDQLWTLKCTHDNVGGGSLLFYLPHQGQGIPLFEMLGYLY